MTIQQPTEKYLRGLGGRE